MRFFHEIQPPPTCFIVEAVYWVAVGRLPSWVYIDSEQEYDARDDMAYAPLRALEHTRLDFTWNEVRSCGFDVDQDRYVEASMLSAAGHDPGTIRARWANPPPHADKEILGIVASWERVAKDLEWLNEIERQMEAATDPAWSAIFLHLSSGRLKARGWLEFSEAQQRERESVAIGPLWPAGTFVDVPAKAWTHRGFNMLDSVLITRGDDAEVFQAVQVHTHDLLKLFPTPSLTSAQSLAVDVFPSVALSLDDSAEPTSSPLTPSTRRPGRPEKGGGVAKDVVLNMYGEQFRSAASGAKEALYAEVIDFVKKAFKVTISRSTAQGYFKSIRMTETSPEKPL